MIKPFYTFIILEIQVVEVVCKFIDFVHIFEYKVPNVPRQRYEFLFLFLMKKVQPEIIFPCNFCNKHYVEYMTWKKDGIFLSTENLDNIVIFHFLQCPLFFQEFTCLGRYSRGIFSKQKSLKNRDKVIEKFIKMKEILVPTQCLVPKGHWVKFTIHILAYRQFGTRCFGKTTKYKN